jgi:hypothetical protein
MSLTPELLKQIVGKTIAGIITREGVEAGPRYQLFMIFTDNTYVEFYGDIGWSTHLESGGIGTVRDYLTRFGGRVVVISQGPLEDDTSTGEEVQR